MSIHTSSASTETSRETSRLSSPTLVTERDASPSKALPSSTAADPEPETRHPFCPARSPGVTPGRSNPSSQRNGDAAPGTSGSDPHATSSPSGTPSPSVSARSGDVPCTRVSIASESPSPSVSRVASETA